MKCVRILVLLITFICTAFLSACLQSPQHSEDRQYKFVMKDEMGRPLYVYRPSVKYITQTERQEKTMNWADDWIVNRPTEGFNQPIPHQTSEAVRKMLIDTVESSHEWAIDLIIEPLNSGYRYSSSHTITIEKERTFQKTYGPVLVNPGFKCRLVAFLITTIDEGVFQGDIYRQECLLLGYKWKLVRKGIAFGHWKRSTEDLYFEFETKPIGLNE